MKENKNKISAFFDSFKMKRGVEMAIQIFIVLFVLLAVAMLVLQLVTTQFSKQQASISKLQQQQQLAQQTANAQAECNNACVCDTLSDEASYCTKLVSGGLDALGDGNLNQYTDKAIIGVGACENNIYCSQVSSCTCGGLQLTMKNCISIICQQLSADGVPANLQTQKLQEFIHLLPTAPATCVDPTTGQQATTNESGSWYMSLYTDANGNPIPPSCPG